MRIKSIFGFLVLLLICLLIHPAIPDESGKKPLARQNAFFGLHFDLHPNKTDTDLGADVSTENIARLLNRVKPDYIQYDCKGHVGWAGYPTKIGWPAPGIKKDSLAVWRKVTREHGVALFIHYSGVWDSQAIEHHPAGQRQRNLAGHHSELGKAGRL
jgi:hypothetical protein